MLLLGLAMTAWQTMRATSAERDAVRQRDQAVTAHRMAATERDNVARSNLSLRRLTTEQRRTLYATSMNLAEAAWNGGNPSRTFELLRQWKPKPGEDDLRGFEWHYWNRFAHIDLGTFRLAGFEGVDAQHSPPTLSPDGTRVAAFVTERDGQSAHLKLWAAGTGRELWSVPAPRGESPVGYAVFSQDGRRFAASRFTRSIGAHDGGLLQRWSELCVWDTATGKVMYSNRPPGSQLIGRPALWSDGSRLAMPTFSGGAELAGRLSVLRLSDGKQFFRYPSKQQSHLYPWLSAFSPDGTRLAAVVGDVPGFRLTLIVWELDSSREIWKAPLDVAWLMDLRFGQAGTRVVTRFGDESSDRVVFWDAASGAKRQLLQLPTSSGRRWILQPPAEFEPDGRRLAVPQGTQVYLFDLEPKQPPAAAPLPQAVRGHDSALCGGAFGRDGSRLVTLDAQGVVKQWDPAARQPRLKTPFGWTLRRGFVLPNRDGSRVAFIPSAADLVRRFRITDVSGQVLRESTLPQGHCDWADFSADGRTFALVWHDNYNHTLYLWDAIAGKEVRRLTPPAGACAVVALSPDGSHVALTTTFAPDAGGESSSTLHVWETATGRELLSRRDLRTED